MKLLALLTLSLLLPCVFVQAQNASEYPMQESSLLWKVEGPGIKKGCYLFGTMHLISKDKFYFPEKLKKIVERSEALMMELPGLPNQMETMKYVTLKEGSFFDYFTPEQTDSILVWAKEELNMSEETFRSTMTKMKPFVAVQMAVQMHFIGKTESYEMTLNKIALDRGMEIMGLETIADQMSIFDNLTKEQQNRMVMDGIREGDKAIELTETMQHLYVRKHVDSLYMMIQSDGGVLSEEQSSFLDERNQNWIPKIIEACKKKKVFIAVGAGHLGGPEGVIRLLEKAGYTVTLVKI